MSSSGNGETQAARRQFVQGVIWTVLAAALALGLLAYALQPENPKADFYYLAAALAALAALVNGWSAYQGYRRARRPSPPAASPPASHG
jgi:hypothetical protein